MCIILHNYDTKFVLFCDGFCFIYSHRSLLCLNKSSISCRLFINTLMDLGYMRDKLFRVVIRGSVLKQPDVLASFTNDKRDRQFAVQRFVWMLMELRKTHLNKWYCGYRAAITKYSFVQDCFVNILPAHQILFAYIFFFIAYVII